MKTSRTRRIVSRVAIAGALAVVPVAAVAAPALAATPSASAVDWHNHGGDWHHDHNGPWQQGPQFPQFPQGPQQFLPQTGSAG